MSELKAPESFAQLAADWQAVVQNSTGVAPPVPVDPPPVELEEMVDPPPVELEELVEPVDPPAVPPAPPEPVEPPVFVPDSPGP